MNDRWERAKALSRDEVLIAVSFERFGNTLFAPPYGHCKEVVIRGQSTDPTASFKFVTCPLPPSRMEPYERLREHGFTVLMPPSNWSFQYPPQKLHSELIVEALNRIAQLPQKEQPCRLSGFDHELARSVMEALNEVFPHSLTLIELKYQFCEEPADQILSTVLNALRGDGYIDGVMQHEITKLRPLERIALTAGGRRHLDNEMKRTSKSQQAYSSNEASRFILRQLLSEFKERQLSSADLHKAYKGLSPNELKKRSVETGISEVDFDLALSDLDYHALVKTGPMQLYDNPQGSSVTVIGFFSKKEYSHLTENGYKEAVKSASRKEVGEEYEASKNREPTVFHGSQYINYGQAGAIGPNSTGTINFQQQWGEIQNQVDLGTLALELEQVKKHLQQSATSSSDYQQLALLSEAEEHAKKHDGGKAMEFLSKVGKGVLGIAKDIGTEVAAKVISKSMGLEL